MEQASVVGIFFGLLGVASFIGSLLFAYQLSGEESHYRPTTRALIAAIYLRCGLVLIGLFFLWVFALMVADILNYYSGR